MFTLYTIFPFCLGLALPAMLPVLPDLRPLFVVAFALFPFSLKIIPVRFIILSLLGFLISSWQLQHRIDAQLPEHLNKHDFEMTLEIKKVEQNQDRFIRFTGRIESIHPYTAEKSIEKLSLKGGRVRLSWRHDESLPEIEEGQHWHVIARLSRPRGFVNPGGFDYHAWLLSQDLVATGYVRNNYKAELLVKSRITGIRAMRKVLQHRLFSKNDLAHGGILRALLTGDRSSMLDSQWDTLTKTGTGHLMAISGLHIGLIAFFAFYIARRCVTISPLSNRLSAMVLVPHIASILAAFLYANMSGFSLPSQRALVMVVLVNAVAFFQRRVNPFILLLWAAIFVLFYNPLAVTSNGFFLSFGAVAVLLLGFSFRSRRQPSLWALVSAQLLLFVAMAAILFARQLPVAPVAPLANLIAVPITSLLIIPILFIAALASFIFPGLANSLLSLSHSVLDLLMRVLSALADFAPLLWPMREMGIFDILIFLFLALLFVLPTALGLRTLSLGLLLLLLMSQTQPKTDVRLTVLEVGQGLSIVLEDQGEVMVYDVGAKFSESFDIGSRVVAPYLRYRGYDNIDELIVSHGDNDHSGGLHGLVRQMSVNNTRANHVNNASPCLRGETFKLKTFTVEVLWPTADSLGMSNTNNESCVVSLRNSAFTILLPGDIEKQVEHRLIEEGLLPRDVDVLIAPHHGSKTSSSKEFLDYVNPKSVVFSAGYQNRYHHPAPEVVNRYREAGATVWNTADDGAVIFSFNRSKKSADSLTVKGVRHSSPKPWFTLP